MFSMIGKKISAKDKQSARRALEMEDERNLKILGFSDRERESHFKSVNRT